MKIFSPSYYSYRTGRPASACLQALGSHFLAPRALTIRLINGAGRPSILRKGRISQQRGVSVFSERRLNIPEVPFSSSSSELFVSASNIRIQIPLHTTR